MKNFEKIKARKKSEVIRFIFFFSVFIFSALALIFLPRLTIPLVIAYVFYLVMRPVMPWLMKRGLSRNFSIGIVFFGMIFLTTYPVYKVVPTITEETKNFQFFLPKIEKYIKDNYRLLSKKVKKRTGYEIGDEVLTNSLRYGTLASKTVLLSVPQILASLLEWIILVPFFIFFFLKDARSFKFKLLSLAPNSIFERAYFLFHQFNKKFGDYIFAKFIEASIVGFIITSGLLIMGVKFSFLLGLVAAVTNIIPYIGPFIGMIPAIAWGIAEFGLSANFGAIVILYLVANTIDLAIVFPILVSKIVDLHPLVVVGSVILGSQYLGILGMVLSIPLAASLKLVLLEIYFEVYALSRK